MKIAFFLLLLATGAGQADEFLQFDNGATAWRNGQVHGLSGGTDNGSGGFWQSKCL